DDGDCRCRALGNLGPNRAVLDDHIDPVPDQVSGQFWYPTVIALGVSPVDHDVVPLGVPCVPQSPPKLLRRFAIRRLPDEQEADMSRRPSLLRARQERASDGRATEQSNKAASLHAVPVDTEPSSRIRT